MAMRVGCDTKARSQALASAAEVATEIAML